MMKSYAIPQALHQDEDTQAFYDADEPPKADPRDAVEDYGVFMSLKEQLFYKNDEDFMRFHKRTTKNMHDGLQELLDSSKQTIHKGVKASYNVSINYLTLNRACSVVSAFWQINTLPKAQQDMPPLSEQLAS